MIHHRLLYEKLDQTTATLFEVPSGHHAFDTFPSPRAFAMIDLIREWLPHTLVHHQQKEA